MILTICVGVLFLEDRYMQTKALLNDKHNHPARKLVICSHSEEYQ